MNYLVEAREPVASEFSNIQDLREVAGLPCGTHDYWLTTFETTKHLVAAIEIGRRALIGMGIVSETPEALTLWGIAVHRDHPRQEVGMQIAETMLKAALEDDRPIEGVHDVSHNWLKKWYKEEGFIFDHIRELWVYQD